MFSQVGREGFVNKYKNTKHKLRRNGQTCQLRHGCPKKGGEASVSTGFFYFDIECPQCHHVVTRADGYETDDWTELFVFSGYSPRSAYENSYHGYTCPKCSAVTDIDDLFTYQHIHVHDTDAMKVCLTNMLEDVIDKRSFYDHYWEPDVETAVNRYIRLYPQDPEMRRLAQLYCYAFYDPKQLTKLEPLPGTRIVTADMVLHRPALRKVYLPDGLLEIGDDAFSGSGLSDVFVPRTVTRIGRRAFMDCHRLTLVHSSDDLKIIDAQAFQECWYLKSFFFPDQLEVIGEESFSGCEHLREVLIPPSCIAIGRGAFAHCPSLVIKGKSGTSAEAYATENSIPFTLYT